MKNKDKLNILFKSRAIKTLVLEELWIWEGFDKIYPQYISYPEAIDFDKGFCYRKEQIRFLKSQIVRIDKIVISILEPRAKRSKEIDKYLDDEKQRLEIHLNRLKELRKLRLYSQSNEETK